MINSTKRIQIECIVFREKNNNYEFLLLKRVQKKGGFWQPPCGKLEKKDKSKLNTAYRELLEETNISKEKILKIIQGVYCFVIENHYLTGKPIPPIHEYVYGFEVDPKVKVSVHNNICQEHEDFKWVHFEKALKLLKWDNNKTALIKLNSLLTFRS